MLHCFIDVNARLVHVTACDLQKSFNSTIKANIRANLRLSGHQWEYPSELCYFDEILDLEQLSHLTQFRQLHMSTERITVMMMMMTMMMIEREKVRLNRASSAVKSWSLDMLKTCISPEQLLTLVVDSNAVGPDDVITDQHLTLWTIHTTALYLSCTSPVGPVHPPRHRQTTTHRCTDWPWPWLWPWSDESKSSRPAHSCLHE